MPIPIENKEFWEEQLEKLKASGLSRSEYCRDNDINYHRFGYWIKRLPPVIPTFVPVKVQTAEQAPNNTILCTLALRGHMLKIYDLSALTFVLERLS